MPVIDIHPHIVSPDTKKYPLDPLGGTQSTWSSERPTTYQDMIESMDKAGVDKSALVHSSTAYGYDNSYVLDAVAAVPSRFTAVCSIDVLAPDAIRTFSATVGASGGVRAARKARVWSRARGEVPTAPLSGRSVLRIRSSAPRRSVPTLCPREVGVM